MLQIKGETRGEYFHIICEKCGDSTHNEYFGFETEEGYPDGVPHLKSTCKKCNSSRVFNLMLDKWKDIKGRTKKRSQKYFRMQAKMMRAREERKG
jgi:NAD-dependent SIR2 family protein deacetylase